jgi:tetratricopeptide (TPR) repeat protein
MKKTRRGKQVPSNKSATQAIQSFAAKSQEAVKTDFARSKVKSIFRRNGFWVSIGLIAANLFVFAPVRHYGFVLLDDLPYVINNPHIRGPIWQGIKWAFSTNLAGFWMPITWLSHMLDAHLFCSAAGPQHVTNVIFHVMNSLLLFDLLCRLTDEWKPSAFVAALFAVHPLHVESVAWIAERKDVLSAFFWLLALLAYHGYVRKAGRRRYLMVLIFFGLGLMAKPTLVTLPFGLLLLDIWPLRRLQIERGQQQAWLRLTLEKFPMFAMAVAASAVTVMMSLDKGNIGGSEKFPLSLRLGNACVSYVAYIRDAFWPTNLAAFYPIGPIPTWQVAGSILVLLAISVLTIWNFRRFPYLLVGWLWYLGTLVPVIGLVQAGSQSRADRYTYMPLVGLLIAGTWSLAHPIYRWKYHQIALSIAAGILVLGCAIEARGQVQYWENGFALWQHALENTKDNFVAHTLLGLALADERRYGESITHYREALRIQPTFAMAHNNLGIALGRTDRVDEAIPEFEAALRIDNTNAEAHYNLGFALANQGRLDDAIFQYTKAVELDPGYIAAITRRGDAFFGENRMPEAIADYTDALRRQPDFVEALNNLGMALVSEGKDDEGITRYNEALRIRPDFPDAHNNLGVALANKGKYDDAIAHFREALRTRPDYGLARANLQHALEIRENTK